MLPVQVFKAYDKASVPKSNEYNFCPSCGGKLLQNSCQNVRTRCLDCGWIYYRNPLPGVVVLVIDKDRILLGKRGNSSFAANKWCIPGGFIEYDEDFLSAALREVHEETGLKIQIQSILSVVSNFLSPKLHTLVVVLYAEIIGGVAKPGDDLCDLKWFSLAGSFPEMAFEADQHIIERFYRTKLKGVPVDPNFASLVT